MKKKTDKQGESSIQVRRCTHFPDFHVNRGTFFSWKSRGISHAHCHGAVMNLLHSFNYWLVILSSDSLLELEI